MPEAAYVSAGRNGPKRKYHRTLYRRLLKVFCDAKRIAGDAAGSDGADVGTCLDLERRVLEIATAYADHGFRTTLTNAAPDLFTFLRYPGMPPTTTAPSVTYGTQSFCSASSGTILSAPRVCMSSR